MYGLFYHYNGICDTIEVRDMQTACARNILNASRGNNRTDYLIVGYTETCEDAWEIVNNGNLLNLIRRASKDYFELLTYADTNNAIKASKEDQATHEN